MGRVISVRQFRRVRLAFRSDADVRLGTRTWTTPWLRAWWHELHASSGRHRPWRTPRCPWMDRAVDLLEGLCLGGIRYETRELRPAPRPSYVRPRGRSR